MSDQLHPRPSEMHGLDPAELLARGLQTVRPTGDGRWVPPEAAEVARLLPQYQIECLLGRGGMGAVYKGMQLALARPVAIKLLPVEMGADRQFVARFQREARTLARLHHSGIVAVYDFGQTVEGHLYFVMEYVDGTDLRRVLRGPGLQIDQALALISQICDALNAAHRQGVMHRDIKPENILLTAEGDVKLADFGLARPVHEDEDDGLTGTNVVMGTPAYMAPEQHEGQSDHRTDIFALGVMLYEMLTGRPPRGGVVVPVSQRYQVDVRIDEVVLRALQGAPELRFQSAVEMKSAVDQIRAGPAIGGEGSQPPPAPAPGATAPPRALWRWSYFAAVLLGLLLIAGLAQWSRPSPAPRATAAVLTTTATPEKIRQASPSPSIDSAPHPVRFNPVRTHGEPGPMRNPPTLDKAAPTSAAPAMARALLAYDWKWWAKGQEAAGSSAYPSVYRFEANGVVWNEQRTGYAIWKPIGPRSFSVTPEVPWNIGLDEGALRFEFNEEFTQYQGTAATGGLWRGWANGSRQDAPRLNADPRATEDLGAPDTTTPLSQALLTHEWKWWHRGTDPRGRLPAPMTFRFEPNGLLWSPALTGFATWKATGTSTIILFPEPPWRIGLDEGPVELTFNDRFSECEGNSATGGPWRGWAEALRVQPATSLPANRQTTAARRRPTEPIMPGSPMTKALLASEWKWAARAGPSGEESTKPPYFRFESNGLVWSPKTLGYATWRATGPNTFVVTPEVPWQIGLDSGAVEFAFSDDFGQYHGTAANGDQWRGWPLARRKP